MTFEELVAKSLEHADSAEAILSDPGPRQLATGTAQVHATLAEAYARLASAVIVNRASMHAAIDAKPTGGRVS